MYSKDQHALALFEQIEAPRDIDWAKTSMAEWYLLNGKFSEAKGLIDGVIQRAISNQYKSLLVDAYILATKLALSMDDSELALQYVESGLAQAKLNKERQSEAELEALRVRSF